MIVQAVLAPAGQPRVMPGADALVPRRQLIDQLFTAAAPVVLLTAPAGYGKTTLLTQWAATDSRRFVWLSLDGTEGPAATLQERIEQALLHRARGAQPCVLVLDNAKGSLDREAAVVLTTLVDHLTPGSQLVLSSRQEPPLTLARWRAERMLLHLDSAQLAMSTTEADALFAGMGYQLAAGQIDRLVRRTAGWPAGLMLAALALHERCATGWSIEDFSGTDRLCAQYFQEEVLASLPPELVDFLQGTALLDRLRGDVCDAVLQRAGSASVLRNLHRASLFVAPLGRDHSWYGCHPLLRDLLLAQLRAKGGQLEAELNQRASAWFSANDDVERAIKHARAGREIDRVADLVWSQLPRYLEPGRTARLQRWLEGLNDIDRHARVPIVLAVAWLHLLRDDPLGATRWASIAARRRFDGPLPGGPSSVESAHALLRASIAGDGVTSMANDAARSRLDEDPASAWVALASLLEGTARRLQGADDQARDLLSDAIALSGSWRLPAIHARALAQLALLELLRDEPRLGRMLAARAKRLINQHRPWDEQTVIQVESAWSLGLAMDGPGDGAHAALRRATATLRLLPYARWLSIDTGLILARAQTALGDVVAAQALVIQARRHAAESPDFSVFAGPLDDAWLRLKTFRRAGMAHPPSLSPAELRVLRLLPTHLSYPEIGSRHHVSAFTVKSQALAIYRKLEVSSRSEAVLRATELGFLPKHSAI